MIVPPQQPEDKTAIGQSVSVKRNSDGLTVRCVTALVATALLVGVGAVLGHNTTAAQTRDALVINQSGRQRMLLNRTAQLAHRLCLAEGAQQKLRLRDKLQASVDSFERNHQAILLGDEERHLPPAIPSVRSIYGGKLQLNQRALDYIAIVKQLLAHPDDRLKPENQELVEIERILEDEGLLGGLDRVVTAFQLDSQAKVAHSESLNATLTLIIVTFLLLIGLCVFAPMIREVRRKNESLQNAHSRLARKSEEQSKTLSELSASREHLRKRAELMTNITDDLRIERQRLAQEIVERRLAEEESARLTDQLVETSRRAGMAEVATGVLHNVGNVLNSVNVAANCLTERLENSRVTGLARATEMLIDHGDHIADFLTQDERGKLLPEYLNKVSQHLIAERDAQATDLTELTNNIEHIKEIVTAQQEFGKVSGVETDIDLVGIIEEAIKINFAGLKRHGVELHREYEKHLPKVRSEKHKIMQIVVNLISNAKYAVSDPQAKANDVQIKLMQENETVQVHVIDTGCGISKDDMTKIFQHGFTTKQDGHGYGLHSCALAANQIGGSLSCHSDGPGQGACFTLRIPLEIPAEVEVEE
jgi:signal transduction histidine kinase